MWNWSSGCPRLHSILGRWRQGCHIPHAVCSVTSRRLQVLTKRMFCVCYYWVAGTSSLILATAFYRAKTATGAILPWKWVKAITQPPPQGSVHNKLAGFLHLAQTSIWVNYMLQDTTVNSKALNCLWVICLLFHWAGFLCLLISKQLHFFTQIGFHFLFAHIPFFFF